MTKTKSRQSSAARKARRLRKEGKAQLRRLQRLNKTTALTQLKRMDPILFEYLVAALFEQRGYKTSLTVTSGGGDEGVDILIRKGLKKGVVQCKRYEGSVGQPVIRDLYGTMLHNRAGESYLVTTAMVTKQAQTWSQGKPIHLIDGYTLVEWMFESKSAARNRRLLYGLIALGLVAALAIFYWPSGPSSGPLSGVLTPPGRVEATVPAQLPGVAPPDEDIFLLYLPLIMNSVEN